MDKKVFSLVITSLFAALVAVATMIISVPAPSASGYIHAGDSMVYLTGLLLGPVLGPIASGFGSAIADGLLGYYIYMPATLVIKALDAGAAVLIYKMIVGNKTAPSVKIIGYCLATVGGGFIMVGGYFLYECFLIGTAAALPNVIANIIQAMGGALLGLPVFIALQGGKVFEMFQKRLA